MGKQAAEPTTTLELFEQQIDFGEIVEGEIVTQVFTFANTGDHPLILIDARGSCGCTVPAKPSAPILPGEVGSITVQFNSRNKRGDRQQRVTITANTQPAQTYLFLTGTVLRKPDNPQTEQPGPVKNRKTSAGSESLTCYCSPFSPGTSRDKLIDCQTLARTAKIVLSICYV